MEILKSTAQVKEKFEEKDKLVSSHFIRIMGYGSLKYKCACSQTHGINDKGIKCIASAKPIKALLKCPNNYVTMVRIDGYFKKKAISEYGYDANLINI